VNFIINYLKLILERNWLYSFFCPHTVDLEFPSNARGIPVLTGNRCTHCFLCQMICPAPGAIDVVKSGVPATWNPRIYEGHCIRCGLCVEICPEITIASGRIFQKMVRAGTYADVNIFIRINPVTCCGCGSCAVSCPISQQEDKILSSKGTLTSDKVILAIESGIAFVINEERCTGCCTCQNICPTKSIQIIRDLEMKQVCED